MRAGASSTPARFALGLGSRMTPDTPLACAEFADGSRREVWSYGDRQYVVDDLGDRVYGVWLLPPDEPLIIRTEDPT